ncbi:MAG: sigma-70 family RNA polymerase sigma factor [Planctomycetes bacterium]|nr:sigma-70 family RNA polymerase sigma factor [Planctomycetota bacterium]
MSDAPSFSPADLEQHRAFLRRLAGELVRGDAAADDLVQETFVRALERPPAIAAALKSWLARVAQRLASNQRRAAARRTRREAAAARPESIAPHDDALASLELQQRLLAALTSLDEPYRTTLWLRWHEGLGPSAIAARAGLTLKGVEARLTRGLALLRAELDRRSGGERARWLGAVASLATSGPPAALATGLFGGVLAVKKLGIAAALLAVAGAAWWVTRSDERSAPPTSHTTATAPIDAPPLPIDAPMAARTELLSAPPAAATPPPLAVAFGSLRVRVRWADGRPAEAITLFACPEAAPNAPRVVLEQKSDAQGETRFAELFAGPVRLEADRGVEVRTVIAAGAESTIELELVAGVAVEGRVVDEAGAPIAAAELLLISPRRDWLAARVVAHSDERGEFAADELPIGHHLTARTPGRVPAFLQKIEEAPRDAPLKMQFVLDWRGIAVAGRVVDPDGRPVSGARIAAGRNDGQTYGSRDGSVQQRFGMPVTRSDADGRFELTGVEHAELCLAVMADGFPLHFEQLPHWVGVTSFCEVQLARPATLAVEVRTPEGAPVPGATVVVVALGERTAERLPFPLPRASSDAAGVGTLDLLPPGARTIRVEPPIGSSFHSVSFTLAGDPVTPTRHHVTLARDAAIVGRAFESDGTPATWLEVWWYSASSGRSHSTAVDTEGRFRLEPADSPPYLLGLRDPATGNVLLERGDVSPGPELVELHLLPPAALTGAFLANDAEHGDYDAARAHFRDNSAQPHAAGKPLCFAFDRAFRHGANATWSGDNFTCGGLPPGTYRVTIRDDQTVLWQSEWIALAAGETRDLGTIRSTKRRAEEPGDLALALAPADAPNVSVSLRSVDYDVTGFVTGSSGLYGAISLPPGPCFLDVRADGYASQLLPLTIVSGETTELSATLQPGVARTLSFVGTWDELSVTVRDGAGRLVAAQRLTSLDPKGLLLLLPDGRYELSAVSERGARAEGRFAIEGLAPQDAPLRFELR